MKFDKLLKNKYLYYAAVALMVINVLGYVAMGSIECILALGGAAYLAQHFTKNRTLDILVGLFVSNILFGCGRLKEGLKNGAEKAGDAAATLQTESKVAAKNGDAASAAAKGHAANAAATAKDVCDANDTECKKKKAAAGAAGKQGFFN
jgi:hypothetical protein